MRQMHAPVGEHVGHRVRDDHQIGECCFDGRIFMESEGSQRLFENLSCQREHVALHEVSAEAEQPRRLVEVLVRGAGRGDLEREW
jgi:hypothetical protein